MTEVVQEVAPLDALYTWGEATFYSLPQDNEASLPGIFCSNTTSSGLSILPVIVDPWEFTVIQRRNSTVPVVTIGDHLSLTIRACVPEIFSGLVLYADIPQVLLDNATVIQVGSKLLRRTLEAGDGKSLVAGRLFGAHVASYTYWTSFVHRNRNLT